MGNRDRWTNNLFWDPDSGRLVAIDFGESFLSPLSELALAQLPKWEISRCQQLAGLRSLWVSMDRLLRLWSEERIQGSLNELCAQLEIEGEPYRCFVRKQVPMAARLCRELRRRMIDWEANGSTKEEQLRITSDR